MTRADYENLVRGSPDELRAREAILELFKESPIPESELLPNLGAYLRSTVVAKILWLNELYQRIESIPGIIVEFGVWWGANLALFQSLRSVYDPYNYTRRVVGFDTFEGYSSLTDKDGTSPYATAGGYAVTAEYEEYLGRLLHAHEADNVMAHIEKHELVKGDVVDTVERYMQARPQTIVALAYFDLALYEPTRVCLNAIRPHLVRGSVLALDELNSQEFPGETIAVREVLGLDNCRMVKSRFLPDRSYVVIE
jgi:hypothetical protein